mmetsp:Transcript_4105/g.12708  ORF Transcript_4105/g.12708 Transcript_4105/m.12708 type:complete len:251 (+) Transcript_4105:851-1603(+)
MYKAALQHRRLGPVLEDAEELDVLGPRLLDGLGRVPLLQRLQLDVDVEAGASEELDGEAVAAGQLACHEARRCRQHGRTTNCRKDAKVHRPSALHQLRVQPAALRRHDLCQRRSRGLGQPGGVVDQVQRLPAPELCGATGGELDKDRITRNHLRHRPRTIAKLLHQSLCRLVEDAQRRRQPRVVRVRAPPGALVRRRVQRGDDLAIAEDAGDVEDEADVGIEKSGHVDRRGARSGQRQHWNLRQHGLQRP